MLNNYINNDLIISNYKHFSIENQIMFNNKFQKFMITKWTKLGFKLISGLNYSTPNSNKNKIGQSQKIAVNHFFLETMIPGGNQPRILGV